MTTEQPRLSRISEIRDLLDIDADNRAVDQLEYDELTALVNELSDDPKTPDWAIEDNSLERTDEGRYLNITLRGEKVASYDRETNVVLVYDPWRDDSHGPEHSIACPAKQDDLSLTDTGRHHNITLGGETVASFDRKTNSFLAYDPWSHGDDAEHLTRVPDEDDTEDDDDV